MNHIFDFNESLSVSPNLRIVQFQPQPQERLSFAQLTLDCQIFWDFEIAITELLVVV